MIDILDKLADLHKQATTERSHHYVAATVQEAIAEIAGLRASRDRWKAQVLLAAADAMAAMKPPVVITPPPFE